MRCQECGKTLTNEEDCYGHDCEVKPIGKNKFLGLTIKEVLKDISSRSQTDETDEKYFNYIMKEIFKVNVKCVCGIVYPTIQSIQDGCKDTLKVLEQGVKV